MGCASLTGKEADLAQGVYSAARLTEYVPGARFGTSACGDSFGASDAGSHDGSELCSAAEETANLRSREATNGVPLGTERHDDDVDDDDGDDAWMDAYRVPEPAVPQGGMRADSCLHGEAGADVRTSPTRCASHVSAAASTAAEAAGATSTTAQSPLPAVLSPDLGFSAKCIVAQAQLTLGAPSSRRRRATACRRRGGGSVPPFSHTPTVPCAPRMEARAAALAKPIVQVKLEQELELRRREDEAAFTRRFVAKPVRVRLQACLAVDWRVADGACVTIRQQHASILRTLYLGLLLCNETVHAEVFAGRI